MDIEVKENQYETEQELLKLSALESRIWVNEVGVFDFEFKTKKEFYEKQRTTWEFQYKCIRVKHYTMMDIVLIFQLKLKKNIMSSCWMINGKQS